MRLSYLPDGIKNSMRLGIIVYLLQPSAGPSMVVKV